MGTDTRAYFTGVTVLISLPTGTKIFDWLSTYLGNPKLLQLKTSSALFALHSLFINDSVYSSVFFFLTGLHFFHLVVGLFLLFLFFWSSSFPYKKSSLFLLRVSEVHLFYNLLVFYWHFLEILWFFIFLVLYL